MIDYCDSDQEQKENPHAREILTRVAKGDAMAFDFMWRFWNFMHVYDDLVDQDKPIGVETAAQELLAFVQTISFNPFYQKHSHQLYPLIVRCCHRWVTGDEMLASDDDTKRAQSTVVRCGELDLFMYIAYLIGGWTHMREIESLMQYDQTQ